VLNIKLILAGIILVIVLCFLFVAGAVSVKADENLINMTNLREGDLLSDGFILNAKTRINIHAVGSGFDYSDYLYAYGWIINADSREPVWVLEEQDTRSIGRRYNLREFDDEITLDAGRYECYFYAGAPYISTDGTEITIDNLGDAIDIIGSAFDQEKKKRKYLDPDEDYTDLLLTITAPAGSFAKFDPLAKLRENAIVECLQPGDDYSVKKGFTLKKEMSLKIIAIGEYSTSDGVFVDYGWIINADTRKKVWQMDKWNTSWAGGGRKNRGFNENVVLPAGNYLANYVTDDSHSFEDWNTPPPYDPMHYGLIISPANAADKQYVSAYEDTYSEPIVIQMTKIRDNEFVSKGFTLKNETNLHVVAIGEYGYDDAFADYGWFENLSNNEKVWEMTEDNTEHAGGASKNRKFDGIVTLPAGNYMAYYVSDDSHSYRDWNSTAPIDKEMWGLTIFGMGKNFNPASVQFFDEIPNNNTILAKLTGLGDDEDVEKRFEITTAQKIHIYALGEGKEGEMYDYGWIENERNGDVVWEMTYRMTRYAGGAKKNRSVDADLLLQPGKYSVHFITDGSHSFPDFNEERPDNPQKWGILITKE
jgi:hypothetical protein